jgi:glutaminyl-peptide cyclotransferase
MAIGVALVALSSLGLLGYALRQNRNTPMQPDASLAADPKPAPIDGRRAYGYLKQICDLGPRPAGSAANTRQRELVAEHFRKLGATVREQKFDGRDPVSGRPVAMANLVASWFPERGERIVIAAHYDTRPHPDQETDPALRRKPFLGANDGASGVALLMEIAHHLDEQATPWGVDLVLFDGEELVYVDDFGRTIGEYFLGSKEFARRYQASRRTSRGRSSYVAGILLDMVGGKDLDLPREPHSVQFAGGLVRQVWDVARKVGAGAFSEDLGRAALDDHLPLNDAGIPTIDIIDFEYPHWHLASDLPEQCAPESLEQVGRVVTAWLSLPKPQPQRRGR